MDGKMDEEFWRHSINLNRGVRRRRRKEEGMGKRLKKGKETKGGRQKRSRG